MPLADVVLSLSVYTGLGVALFGLAWRLSRRDSAHRAATGRPLPFLNLETVLAILLFATVAGLRYHTGFDHEAYLNQYHDYLHYGFVTRDVEPLFQGVMMLMGALGLHYFFFFAFWAALQIGFVFYAFNDRKDLLPWVCVCVMSFLFLHWMNTIRQGVVEAMFVAMVAMAVKRRFWPYLLLTVLGVTIHRSAVLMLLFYFIPSFRPAKRASIVAAVAIIVCALAGSFPQWLNVFRHVSQWIGAVGFESYSHMLSRMFDIGFRDVAWGPSRLAVLAVVLIVVAVAERVDRMPDCTPQFPVYLTYAVIGYCYTALLVRTDVFVLRPGEYLTTFIPIAAACVLAYLHRYGRRAFFVSFLVLVCTPIYWSVIKLAIMPNGHEASNLYHTFLL